MHDAPMLRLLRGLVLAFLLALAAGCLAAAGAELATRSTEFRHRADQALPFAFVAVVALACAGALLTAMIREARRP